MIVPEILNGDPAPFDALDPGSNWDFMAWLGKHGGETVLPVLDKVVPALQTSGITKLAALGFCYGARPAFDLAFVNTVSVVVVSHPSLLKVPDDIEVLTCLCVLLDLTQDAMPPRNTRVSPRHRSSSTVVRLI